MNNKSKSGIFVSCCSWISLLLETISINVFVTIYLICYVCVFLFVYSHDSRVLIFINLNFNFYGLVIHLQPWILSGSNLVKDIYSKNIEMEIGKII